MANPIPFHKQYTNPRELVALLRSRGLVISDPIKAERLINHIGYYRLSAYMYPLLQMPKNQHLYKQGVSFRTDHDTLPIRQEVSIAYLQ